MDEVEKTQKRVCDEWIEGYEQWTPEGVTRHRHADCVHVQLPHSMHVPERTNDQYKAYFSKVLFKTIKNFKTKPRVVVNDPRSNIAVLHITATSESEIGAYDNEYIFILWFTKDGKEIVRIEEMVDSKRTAEFFAKLLHHLHHPPSKDTAKL